MPSSLAIFTAMSNTANMDHLPTSTCEPESKPLWMTAALYQFVPLDDCAALQTALQTQCQAHSILGLLLLAPEGINGTIAGTSENVHALLDWLRSDPRFHRLEHKEAWSEKRPFYRMRVRIKREIVTMGVEGINPTTDAGTYVPPEQWNALITDPEVVVIDVRNDYEVRLGSFEGAINPGTRHFRDFPQWIKSQQAQGGILAKPTKVAMFCTGGIRCEKSTAFLKSQGFDEVYHLQGGILKYLETVPQHDSRWQGDCFVFDDRVSVQHDLTRGHYHLCRICRMPLSAEDLESEHYWAGVRCHHCYDTHTHERSLVLAERERRIRQHWAADAATRKALPTSHATHADASPIQPSPDDQTPAPCPPPTHRPPSPH